MGLGLVGVLPSAIVNIEDGPAGTWQTLAMMGQLTAQYKKNPLIRRLATLIVQPLPNKAWGAEMAACLNFVRGQIRYTQDINDVETLQTPIATLQLAHGDCDDMCVLLASLLEAVGHPTRFVAIGFEPQQFTHVFLEILNFDTDRWVAADPTEPNPLGWSAAGYCCRMEFNNN